jgi:hypothetical protein
MPLPLRENAALTVRAFGEMTVAVQVEWRLRLPHPL